MQVYRARNPQQSPLWQCANRHSDQFEEVYPEQYQPRYGFLRPIIPEVVHKFLDCGNLCYLFLRLFVIAAAPISLAQFPGQRGAMPR